jgi:hypothetical protein
MTETESMVERAKRQQAFEDSGPRLTLEEAVEAYRRLADATCRSFVKALEE